MITIALIVFAALAALGIPLFIAFSGLAMAGFSLLEDTPIVGAVEDVFSERFADSPMLVTIPLFTFAGYLMAESNAPQRLVSSARAWYGWMPGGVALVCLVASAFFTTFTGGSGITIVAIGGLLLPMLKTEGYPKRFSLGLVTSGGSLGLLFPPSIPIILYGVVGGVLIEKLFAASFIPSVLTLVLVGIYSMFAGKKSQIKREPFDLGIALRASWDAKWELCLPVSLVFGLANGLRIHEAAAFTALYVMCVEFFIHRDLALIKDLPRIVSHSMTLVGAIMLILMAAVGVTAFLTQAQVPEQLLSWIATVVDPNAPFARIKFLLLLNIFLLAVGMMMDVFSAIVVVAPLVIPLSQQYGIDPYHLGVVFLLNLEIGYLTPPVGLNLFIASYRFNQPVTVLYRSVLPFILILLAALAATTYIPSLSLGPANLIKHEELDTVAPKEDINTPDEGSGPTLEELDAEFD